jgi:hypothetical protein
VYAFHDQRVLLVDAERFRSRRELLDELDLLPPSRRRATASWSCFAIKRFCAIVWMSWIPVAVLFCEMFVSVAPER